MSTRREKLKRAAAEARAGAGIDAPAIKFLSEPVINKEHPEYAKEAGTFWIGKDLEAQNLTGKKFVALVDDAMRGYRKFSEGKVKVPVYAVVAVAGDVLPPERDLLGDLNESRWPPSKFRDGERQDPWRRIWILPIYDVETGDIIVFSPETNGGINAIADLVDAYAGRPDGDEKLPLVSLQSYSRAGSNGKRFFPILRVEGWVDRPAGAHRLSPPPLPIAPVPHQDELDFSGAAPRPRKGNGTNLMDDDIPFAPEFR
jgi:hypothetical protein